MITCNPPAIIEASVNLISIPLPPANVAIVKAPGSPAFAITCLSDSGSIPLIIPASGNKYAISST